MKKVKVIVAILAAIAIFVGGVYVGFKVDTFSIFQHEATYSSEIIKDEIVALSDVTTQKEIVDGQEFITDDVKVKGHKIPFTNKKLLVKYQGIIKVATDLSKADVDIATEDNKTVINVTLKKCKISDIYINEDSWEYLDSKSFVFNRLKPDDDGKLREKVMDTLKQQAKDNDLVGKGNEQAKVAIAEFLKMAHPDAEIVVEVK